MENWIAGLGASDRIVMCAIVRGELLFGIARLPDREVGGRNWKKWGAQFLAAFHCEPVPERAGGFYAAVRLARQQRGLASDENDLWVAATALALGATSGQS